MSRFKSICGWVLQLLLGALFAIQGIMKLSGSPTWISRFRAWGYPDRFYFVVGLAELLGAVLLLIPRLAKFGAVMLIVVMVGATATHLIHRERQIMTTVILATLLAISVHASEHGYKSFGYLLIRVQDLGDERQPCSRQTAEVVRPCHLGHRPWITLV